MKHLQSSSNPNRKWKKTAVGGASVGLSMVMAMSVFASAGNTAGPKSPSIKDSARTASSNSPDADKTSSTVTTPDSSTGTEKLSKEETVFILSDASGKASSTIVSEHLKGAGSVATLRDESELENIKNLKGEEGYTSDGTSLTWKTDGKDIYYQGTANKEAPIGVSFTYFLDGKEISPDALSGKSGKLKIQIQYLNHTRKTVNIQGKKTEISAPFLMMTGLILPTDHFTNVEVDHGKLINDGSKNIVLGYGLPGMSDTLRLNDASGLAEALKTDDNVSSLSFPDSVTVTADVTDFKLDSPYTVALSDIFSDIGTISLPDTLDDQMAQLKDASVQLKDGAGELANGTGLLSENYSALKDGIVTLADGIEALKNGAAPLIDGTSSYISGVNALSDGIFAYTSGEEQLAKGSARLSDASSALHSLSDGLGALELAVGSSDSGNTLAGGAQRLAEGTALLRRKTAGMQDAFKQLQDLLSTKEELNSQLAAVQEDLHTFSSLQSALSQLQASLQNPEAEAALGNLAASAAAVNTEISSRNQVIGENNRILSQEAHAWEDADAAAASSNAKLKESKEKIQAAISMLDPEKDQAAIAALNSASASLSPVEIKKPDIPEQQKELKEIPLSSLSSLQANLKKTSDMLGSWKEQASSLSDSASDAFHRITGDLAALQKKAEKLSSSISAEDLSRFTASIDQIAEGAKALSDNTAKLSASVSRLHQGAEALSTQAGSGITALNQGFDRLTASNSTLQSGASRLKSASSTLLSGSKTLSDGILALSDGGSRLKDGNSLFSDGISRLNTGALSLSDGASRFYEEGILPLNDLFGDELQGLLDRVNTLSSPSAIYENFGGKAQDMNGSVKFLIKTNAIP